MSPSPVPGKCKSLVVYERPATFVKGDIQILKDFGVVRSLQYTGKRCLPGLFGNIARSHLVYCWFILGYATSSVLLSKIFRKRSVLVAGGWDVIHLPEIDYGAMSSEKRIKRTKYALRKADRVLAVSESTKRNALQWVDRDVDVVYNAVDTLRFVPKGEKRNLVITVAAVSDLVRYRTKGLNAFLGAAEMMPDIEFMIVGENSPEWNEELRKRAPQNVAITGRMSEEDLLACFQQAKVYAQLSYHESFGVALAEAMSCECIPVVTNRYALPEVVGDTGYYVEYDDVEGTVETIRKAIDEKNGGRCRERVKSRFDKGIRKERLLSILREVLAG